MSTRGVRETEWAREGKKLAIVNPLGFVLLFITVYRLWQEQARPGIPQLFLRNFEVKPTCDEVETGEIG